MIADAGPGEACPRVALSDQNENIKRVNPQKPPPKINAPRFALHEALLALQPKRDSEKKGAQREKEVNADMSNPSKAMERNDLRTAQVIEHHE